jgi:hypothetical protein
MKLLERASRRAHRAPRQEKGIVGYGIAWLLGVPATLLVIIYLLMH